jgi:putative transposase
VGRKRKFTDSQIILALKQLDQGLKAADLCRKLEVTEQTLYRWKKTYSGMEVSDLKELRVLRDENKRLKSLVADLTLDKRMLQDVLEKKL